MAIYSFHMKVFSRGSGASPLAKSAYRSGSRIHDAENGRTYNYMHKKEVVHSEIILCTAAPPEYLDRVTLWTAVQKKETRKDARLAREIMVALPRELPLDKNIDIVRRFVMQNLTSNGYIADVNIHDKGEGNPHAHILISARPLINGKWGSKTTSRFRLGPDGKRIPVIDPDTGQQKRRKDGRLCYERENVAIDELSTRDALLRLRKSWADTCNRELEKAGIALISEKSNAERGIYLEPTIHAGHTALKIEAEGSISERCAFNRSVKEKNNRINMIRNRLEAIAVEIKRLIDERKRTLLSILELLNDDGPDIGQGLGR